MDASDGIEGTGVAGAVEEDGTAGGGCPVGGSRGMVARAAELRGLAMLRVGVVPFEVSCIGSTENDMWWDP